MIPTTLPLRGEPRLPFAGRLAAASLAAVLALGLGACSRDDGRTPGQKLDSAIGSAEQKMDQAKADADRGLDKAKAGAEAAAERSADAVKNAADTVTDKVSDAAITVAVNAELAKDPTLSALKIDVDTREGRVVLNGSAPDTASRERATQLAAAVKGVSSVDNRLAVRG